ncbi:MAG: RsfS/YbeB/iojap family protein [Actinomycetota bacterium]|nr:RsfS/YbeB/iojap family protein [Actinomycetota bacterium]
MLILFLVTLLNKKINEKQKLIKKSIDVLISQNCFNIQNIELNSDAFADNIILSTARSQRQIAATIDKLKSYYKSIGVGFISEGDSTTWALIATDIAVINILTEESRSFYLLEDLYFDCKITNIDT